MSSRIYVKPDMKVIPLEAEGLAPLSANGIKIGSSVKCIDRKKNFIL